MMIGVKQLAEGGDRHRIQNHAHVVLWTVVFAVFVASMIRAFGRHWRRALLSMMAAAVTFQILTFAQPALWIGIVLTGIVTAVAWWPVQPVTYGFKSERAEAKYLAAYDALMQTWPVPHESIELSNRFGRTLVVACGPKDAPPLVLLHGYLATLNMWLPNITDLSRPRRACSPGTLRERRLVRESRSYSGAQRVLLSTPLTEQPTRRHTRKMASSSPVPEATRTSLGDLRRGIRMGRLTT